MLLSYKYQIFSTTFLNDIYTVITFEYIYERMTDIYIYICISFLSLFVVLVGVNVRER